MKSVYIYQFNELKMVMSISTFILTIGSCFSVHSVSSYGAFGKFGEHETSVLVAQAS